MLEQWWRWEVMVEIISGGGAVVEKGCNGGAVLEI